MLFDFMFYSAPDTSEGAANSAADDDDGDDDHSGADDSRWVRTARMATKVKAFHGFNLATSRRSVGASQKEFFQVCECLENSY